MTLGPFSFAVKLVSVEGSVLSGVGEREEGDLCSESQLAGAKKTRRAKKEGEKRGRRETGREIEGKQEKGKERKRGKKGKRQ